jgi:hypothetical protein
MSEVQCDKKSKFLGVREFNCLKPLPKFAQTKKININGQDINVRAEVASGYFIFFNSSIKEILGNNLYCDINKNWWDPIKRSSIPELEGKTPLQVIEYYVS